MSAALKPFRWFYYEFGISSINETGRNAWLIIIARSCRMFAYGTNSLILALFFAELKFSDYRIGLFMTLTLLGDVFLGLGLTLIADKVGRRKVLIGGSFLMVLSGFIFAVFENYWILLLAAVIGVVSATGGDFGPFRAIEESVLSQLTTPKTRSDVLAWYVTISSLGSAIGSEAGGRIVHALRRKDGWHVLSAYHALFWIYTAMGFVNALLSLLLTRACEIPEKEEAAYAQIAQADRDSIELEEQGRANGSSLDQQPLKEPSGQRTGFWLVRQLSLISAPTRKIMYQLWALLAVDSIADGMVPYSLTNYYLDQMFHPSTSLLGDVTSISYFLGAISGIFAGPLARKIGLINTMVFTHVPSSAAVLVFGLPNSLVLDIILLMIRAGLNNMDQAPRSAFIAAVVKAEERTAVMGITNLLRTLAAMTGPTITGVLAGNGKFWIAFLAAGAFRLAYDFGLYFMFVNVKLYQHEKGVSGDGGDEETMAGEHGVDERMLLHDHGDDVEVERTGTPESLASSDKSRQI